MWAEIIFSVDWGCPMVISRDWLSLQVWELYLFWECGYQTQLTAFSFINCVNCNLISSHGICLIAPWFILSQVWLLQFILLQFTLEEVDTVFHEGRLYGKLNVNMRNGGFFSLPPPQHLQMKLKKLNFFSSCLYVYTQKILWTFST